MRNILLLLYQLLFIIIIILGIIGPNFATFALFKHVCRSSLGVCLTLFLGILQAHRNMRRRGLRGNTSAMDILILKLFVGNLSVSGVRTVTLL